MKPIKLDKSNWRVASQIWDRYSSPFRLSNGDIKTYLEFLRDKKKRILLLGATPELRRVIPGEFILTDFSYNMISGMPLYDKKIDIRKETWVLSNWLNLNSFLPEKSFDLILGDLVLRNIKPEKQNDFLRTISILLKKTGVFITRVHILNENVLKEKSIVQDSFDKHLSKKNELLEDLITSRLFDKNTKEKRIDKKGFEKEVKYFLSKEKSKRKKTILENIFEKWQGPKTWTQRKKKEIEKMLFNQFLIRETRISSDYIDSEFYPIYILKNGKKS